MSDNKLVKMFMDAATLTSFAAIIGWISREFVKKNFTPDPSSSGVNYLKFTVAMAGSIVLKNYLEDQKIYPTNTQ